MRLIHYPRNQFTGDIGSEIRLDDGDNFDEAIALLKLDAKERGQAGLIQLRRDPRTNGVAWLKTEKPISADDLEFMIEIICLDCL